MAKQKRIGRLLRRLGLLLLLLVGLVAAVPTIVSRTSLRDTLIASQLPSGWSLESQQASLGWMSGQTLTGVTLTDGEGRPMLTVELVTLSKTLVSLAMNQKQLGKLEIVRPVATLETHASGSNWEDFLLAMDSNKPTSNHDQQLASSQSKQHIEIEIVDGSVRGIDLATKQNWLLDAANVTAEDRRKNTGKLVMRTVSDRNADAAWAK